jgi:predicted O-methyltransferase YrrM
VSVTLHFLLPCCQLTVLSSNNSFNKFVRDDERLSTVVLPIRDGVTVIRRRI